MLRPPQYICIKDIILLVVGCWLLVVGCWLLVVGCWLLFVVGWLLGRGEAYSLWHGFAYRADNLSVQMTNLSANASPSPVYLYHGNVRD
ncbi:hypothetical protein [Planktothricoides raciborskii]|uniref:hypothetical protein n=1 Tax=Planktothricoides raciborskii TaxID=132608 RepID=UPI0035C8F35B